MAQDLERLIVTLDADLRKYQASLAKAQGITVSQLRKVEREVEASKTRISRSFASLGGFLKGGLVGAIAGFASVEGIRRMREIVANVASIGDQAQRLGLSTDEFQRLAFVAKQGNVDVDAFAKAMAKLGINSSDAARGAGELGEIFKLNGVAVTDANGKMLSQLEILKRVAELIKNAASEQDKLNIAQAAFGPAGVQMLSALEGGAKGVQEAFAAAAETKPIDPEAIQVAKDLDAEFNKIGQLIINTLNPAIVTFQSYLVTAMKVGLESVYNLIDGFYILEKAIGVIDQIPQYSSQQGKGNVDKDFSAGGTYDLRGNKVGKVTPKPTVLPTEDAPKVKRTGGGGGGGGGGTKTANEYQQETQQIKEQIDALKLQAETFGKTAGEAAKLEAAHRLLNAAQEAGLKITPELQAQIDALAKQYGSATDALQDLADQQQTIDDINSSLRESITGFASDLRNGVDAMDALSNAANKLIDKLTDLALNSLLDQLLGGGSSGAASGGGLLTTFFSGLFGGFRAAGGPVAPGKGYVVGENGPEWFQPATSGQIMPGVRGGSPISVKIIDNAGTAISTRASDNGRDGKQLTLIIDQRVQRQIGDPYSKSSPILTARGAKVAAKRR